METQSLTSYVEGRIRSAVPKAEVVEELLSIGWTEDDIETAFREAVIALGAPVPDSLSRGMLTRKAGAVDVVINFFSFILLGIVATALGTLFFQVINLLLPDVLALSSWYDADSARSAIHYAIAALLIGFPLYYASLRLWFRKFREDEGRVESKLSKWVTYLVLLVTAVTIVGDLIVTVFTFLQGEITLRFFLKALVILGIAGAIFGFYFLERKKIQYRVDIPRLVFQRFGWGISAVVGIGIVLGFVVSGSPMTERLRGLDNTRETDLSMLAGCIESYALDIGRLPTSLADLRQSNQYSYCSGSMNDPETGEAYEYRIVMASRQEALTLVGEFELCATFALPSDEQENFSQFANSNVWAIHGAGHSCDTVTARLTTPAPVSVPLETMPIVPSK
ncbi:MAG: hypothetical protein E6P95_02985 [Candidatus Moraniibacteriota bacterium]|nr:MAG: hypothetical protein E6P95_02985 [Candidatus Moranbacteria bacterium]